MIITNTTKIYKGNTLVTKIYKGNTLIYNGYHLFYIEDGKVYYRPDGTGNADLVVEDGKIYARRVI